MFGCGIRMRCHSMIVSVVDKFTQTVDSCFIFNCVGGNFFCSRSIELFFVNLHFGVSIITSKGISEGAWWRWWNPFAKVTGKTLKKKQNKAVTIYLAYLDSVVFRFGIGKWCTKVLSCRSSFRGEKLRGRMKTIHWKKIEDRKEKAKENKMWGSHFLTLSAQIKIRLSWDGKRWLCSNI